MIQTREQGAGAEEDIATSQAIKHLVLLRHWAEPLKLAPHQVSYHVLESGDPAEALLGYARSNHVDHVVGSPHIFRPTALAVTIGLK